MLFSKDCYFQFCCVLSQPFLPVSEDSISRSQHMTAWESQATKTKITSKWGMPKPGDRWTRQQASPENFKIRELFTAKRNRRGTVTYMGKMELREAGDQPWWNNCQKYPELWKCQPSFTCPHLHFQWQAWLHNLTQSKCHPEHFLSWISVFISLLQPCPDLSCWGCKPENHTYVMKRRVYKDPGRTTNSFN